MSRHKHSVKRRSLPPLANEIGFDRSGGEAIAYACCGRFCVDFAQVCAERGLPYVPEVVQRSFSSFRGDSHASRKARCKRMPCQRPSSVTQFLPPQAKPCITKDNLEFRRPHILVEQDNPDEDRTVSEVHISNWKVDVLMMEVLTRCWPAVPLLHTLHLWNTGLDAHTVTLLASCLHQCSRLTTVVLDNNPLDTLPLSLLIQDNHILQHLSLRWCSITDATVHGIAIALGPAVTACPALLTLNLAGNRIGDEGMGYLAEALQMNRTLLTLNLSSNQVGDAGVACLAQALSWFPVTGDLITARHTHINRQLSQHMVIHPVPKVEKHRPSMLDILSVKGQRGARGASPVRFASPPVGVSKGQALGPKKEVTLNVKDGEKGSKRERKMSTRKKDNSNNITKLVLEIDAELIFSRPTTKPSWHSETDKEVVSYGSHPLLQAGYTQKGDVWLPGNRTLISLNLSRNCIGEKGLRDLLAAIQEQVIPLGDGSCRGLLRLVMSKNAFDVGSRAAKHLNHFNKLKDPLCRHPNINLQKDCISPCAIPVCIAF